MNQNWAEKMGGMGLWALSKIIIDTLSNTVQGWNENIWLLIKKNKDQTKN